MVLDAKGNAYVAISSQLTTGYDIAVLKYRPDGTLTWTQRYDRSRNDLLWDRHTSWSGRSMTLGADGFLYVSGQTVASGEDSDFVVFKMPRS